ncbi:MAG TPA: hypothetical protein VM238_05440 [Phycisphaerae bacterium]|nr:hypothetical protein [Phycisphaerae bacterium]
MLESLRQKLADAKARVREHQKLTAALAEAQRSTRAEEARFVELKAQMENEHADMEALDRLSLAGLFHSILGDKDDQRKKEREEFVAAKLKFDECREALDALDKASNELRGRLKALGDPQVEYEALVAEKVQAIADAGDENTKRLISLAEEEGELRADEAELEEALRAGRTALASLDRCGNYLRSAGNWGVWDMVGGGLISTAIKHGRIDDARRAAHDAQGWLRAFKRELADVNERFDARIEIGGFATFADYFFDGLIADWYVQSKIRRSEAAVSGARSEVEGICTRLRREIEGVRARLADLDDERRRLIEDA